MTELPPALLEQLLHKYPWLLALLSAIGTARIFLKPIGNWLKGLITRAAEKAIGTPTAWDDHWIEELTGWPIYRAFVFLLDLFVSVKLPVREDLFKQNPK